MADRFPDDCNSIRNNCCGILLFPFIVSVIICTLGVFLNAIADNIQLVIISRILIGIGASSPYICALKIIFSQFPKSKHNFYTGLTSALAMLGILLFSRVLEFLIITYNWRVATYFLTCLGLLLIATLLVLKPSKKSIKVYNSNYSFVEIIKIIKTKELWLYTFVTICLYLPLPVFSDIWAGAILAKKYEFTNIITCQISMSGYLGCLIGSLILSNLRQERMVIICSIIGSLSLMLIIMYLETSIMALYLMFFAIGFCAGASIISYRAIARYVDIKYLALSFSVLSTFYVFGLGVINYIIGLITDYLWSGSLGEYNERIYSATNYQHSVTIVIFPIMTIAIILMLPKFSLLKINYQNLYQPLKETAVK